MPKTQYRASLDDYLIPVVEQVTAGANAVLTGDRIWFQFCLSGQRPTDAAWVEGRWVTTPAGANLASILVGPGGDVELAPGRYQGWLKIGDDPTVPVLTADVLTIT